MERPEERSDTTIQIAGQAERCSGGGAAREMIPSNGSHLHTMMILINKEKVVKFKSLVIVFFHCC
jgi:hypothetical protein